jgi:hypothetical protein
MKAKRISAVAIVRTITTVLTIALEAFALALGAPGPTHAAVSPGEILVIDGDAGANGALFTVDPATGSRTILSDFGNAIQGPTGNAPFGLAIEASGTILVIDQDAGTSAAGALFTVDPATGSRTILSDFGNPAQGPTGANPIGLAIEASGTLLVIDGEAGTGGNGALFTVDPTTGSRTILSDFGNLAQGPTGANPIGLAIEASGTLLVIDPDAGTGGNGALFTVDPATGSRTILSDFGNAIQGPMGTNPIGLAIFDSVPPDTAITSAVDGKGKPVANGGKTSSKSIAFTFTGSDNVAVSGFECSLDGSVFSACSSPTSSINLTGGTHVFQVRAIDASENRDLTPATFSWFVSGNRFK